MENPSAAPLELVEFFLGENMLNLRAVPAGGAKELALVLPLLSSGPRPLIVAPFAKVERTYQLAVNFPELEKTLERKDVLVSWDLTLKGEKMCFSQSLQRLFGCREKGSKNIGA